MQVAHCVYNGEGSWEFWLEDAARLQGLPTQRGARPTSAAPRPHPFAVPVAALKDALGTPAGTAYDEVGSSVLALPAKGARPCPSRELTDRARLTRTVAPPADHLAAWVVPTLRLRPAAAIRLLDRCADTGGATVGYAAALVALARRVVSEGLVVPSIDHDEDDHRWYATWEPMPSLRLTGQRTPLVAAMPPAFRCWQFDGELTLAPAAEVFDQALDSLVDTFANEALATRADTLLPASRGRRPARTPVAEQWLQALTADDNSIGGDDVDDRAARQFAQQLTRWRTGAHGGTPALVRTCLRLRAPADADSIGEPLAPDLDPTDPAASWQVELLLQSVEDPSLVADATDVWRNDGNARLFADAGLDPQAELLAGLGRAARAFPPLAQALRHATPVAVSLDADGALEFLRTQAVELARLGLGVQLPSWWSSRRPQLGLRLAAATPQQPGIVDKPAAFGMDQLVDYAWQVSLGDDILTEQELAALAEAKTPLVRVRGQWVEVDQRRLAHGLKQLAGHRRRPMTARDVLRAGLLGDNPDTDLPLLAVHATGWLGDLLAGTAANAFAPLPTPAGFGAQLRPYQERGLGWLAFMDSLAVGAVLADDMGLGKTIQVLALLERERQHGSPGPTLLVCPMSLVANWQREAARFAPHLTVHVHHGAERLTGEQFQQVAAGADLVLTTYALALRDQQQLADVDWRRVVVDEAQAIKNAAAKQSRAIRALPAARRIALTGTPVENRLADLHSIMEFASPGLLGGPETFKKRFATPIERDGDTATAARLRQVTGAFMLRRLKTDPAIISDLPDKFEMKVVCNLTREQASLYQAVLDDMLRQVEHATGIDRRGLILATLTKLKQVCNHPAQLLKDGSRVAGRSGKVARVEELCEEVLAAGEKVLLFTQFAEFGTMLAEHLAAKFDQPVPFLHGGVPKKARDAMVASFQQPGGPSMFILSLKAGGVGLNLTAANHVIHVDRWWNPAVEDQATDRAFRIGQRRDVQVRKLLCAGTLEERIDEVLEQKKALAEATVGTGEAWLTELSTQALRDLVALDRDTVVE
ncbi:DEAD/DEAH box helicase [Catellatospora sp. KI3]|uniref:DEAD/DEAH box helicase n=1 Tax=Catellatospora sp. KI3 TaxID=3041620 RepID=UPI0024828E01|nr:DEAD/DEAH box helicase [Catellatospora sp. KI3]MDI1462870.1 DEAD/DEAH box helicase [Catellatospora sp. KI3]